MNKELFIDTINFVKELNEEENKFNTLLREIDNEFGGGFIHSKSINYLVSLLKILVNDENDWISYYCWEIDFGRNYHEGCVTEADDTPIPLSTPEDLWNLITSNK